MMTILWKYSRSCFSATDKGVPHWLLVQETGFQYIKAFAIQVIKENQYPGVAFQKSTHPSTGWVVFFSYFLKGLEFGARWQPSVNSTVIMAANLFKTWITERGNKNLSN